MNKLSLEQGTTLVKSAREAIREYSREKRISRIDKPELEPRGIFVTLETFPKRTLRGCIGFPQPVKPVDEAVREAAVQSAFGDPRFPQLAESELGAITIEISVLTVPEVVEVKSPEEYLKKIVVGRDGLIIECGGFGGLLLPIVPVEWGWTVEQFLEALCQKAGLPSGSWRKPETKILAFESQVFKEETPGGKVIEVDYKKEFGAKKK